MIGVSNEKTKNLSNLSAIGNIFQISLQRRCQPLHDLKEMPHLDLYAPLPVAFLMTKNWKRWRCETTVQRLCSFADPDLVDQ
jgi:hypothetical protein